MDGIHKYEAALLILEALGTNGKRFQKLKTWQGSHYAVNVEAELKFHLFQWKFILKPDGLKGLYKYLLCCKKSICSTECCQKCDTSHKILQYVGQSPAEC